MSAREKRVYFDYDKGVELILKLACVHQGRKYIPCKNQDEIDRGLELFSDMEFCKKISEAACGVLEITHDPEQIQKYKRQGKEPPRLRARYPKAVWEFSRKLRYEDKDKIFIHTRTFWQFKEYIGEPDFSAQNSVICVGKDHPDFWIIQNYFLRSCFPFNQTYGRWTAQLIIWPNGVCALIICFLGKSFLTQTGVMKEIGLGDNFLGFSFQSNTEIKRETTVILHYTKSEKIAGTLFLNGISCSCEAFRKSDTAFPRDKQHTMPLAASMLAGLPSSF